MNTNKQKLEQVEEDFAKRVAYLLNAQCQNLNKDIQERLQEARALAVGHVKTEPLFVAQLQMNNRGYRISTWNKPIWSFTSWLVPAVIVVLGLIGIAEWQEDLRIKDIANVDIALLTDDVPPDAFIDNGFMAYLKLKTSTQPPEEAKAEDEKI